MEKESVKVFDLQAAFKALDEIEAPKTKGLKANRIDLKERFAAKDATSALVEDYYSVYDHEALEEAKEDREDEIAKAKLARIEKIVDLDADTADDLLPSYVGKVIIQCPQCMTLFYKKPEDIEHSEENPDVVNVNEVCQHCGNASGYTVIGKVDEVSDEEASHFEGEENELDLDFPEATEETSPEGTGGGFEEDELNLEFETGSEDSEEELDLNLEEVELEPTEESLKVNEAIEDSGSEDKDETEVTVTLGEIKDVAEEAGKAVVMAEVEEKEEVKEVTDKVVEKEVEVKETLTESLTEADEMTDEEKARFAIKHKMTDDDKAAYEKIKAAECKDGECEEGLIGGAILGSSIAAANNLIGGLGEGCKGNECKDESLLGTVVGAVAGGAITDKLMGEECGHCEDKKLTEAPQTPDEIERILWNVADSFSESLTEGKYDEHGEYHKDENDKKLERLCFELLGKGLNEDEIRAELEKAGYSQDEIQYAIIMNVADFDIFADEADSNTAKAEEPKQKAVNISAKLQKLINWKNEAIKVRENGSYCIVIINNSLKDKVIPEVKRIFGSAVGDLNELNPIELQKLITERPYLALILNIEATTKAGSTAALKDRAKLIINFTEISESLKEEKVSNSEFKKMINSKVWKDFDEDLKEDLETVAANLPEYCDALRHAGDDVAAEVEAKKAAEEAPAEEPVVEESLKEEKINEASYSIRPDILPWWIGGGSKAKNEGIGSAITSLTKDIPILNTILASNEAEKKSIEEDAIMNKNDSQGRVDNRQINKPEEKDASAIANPSEVIDADVTEGIANGLIPNMDFGGININLDASGQNNAVGFGGSQPKVEGYKGTPEERTTHLEYVDENPADGKAVLPDNIEKQLTEDAELDEGILDTLKNLKDKFTSDEKILNGAYNKGFKVILKLSDKTTKEQSFNTFENADKYAALAIKKSNVVKVVIMAKATDKITEETFIRSYYDGKIHLDLVKQLADNIRKAAKEERNDAAVEKKMNKIAGASTDSATVENELADVTSDTPIDTSTEETTETDEHTEETSSEGGSTKLKVADVLAALEAKYPGKRNNKIVASMLKNAGLAEGLTEAEIIEVLNEHIQDRPAPIEDETKYQGMDNQVVPCKTTLLVSHSEDEKPLDCKMEKEPLEKPLTGEKVEIKVLEDFNERFFDKAVNNFLKEVYENVSEYKTNSCELKEDKIFVEGTILFNSGRAKKTVFEFLPVKEEFGSLILEGYNKDLTEEKAFTVKGALEGGDQFVTESFGYKYTINETLVEGLAK